MYWSTVPAIASTAEGGTAPRNTTYPSVQLRSHRVVTVGLVERGAVVACALHGETIAHAPPRG
eukprot:scaffold12325_cov71-Phaeocystis_antarctica.AAC.2